MRRVIALVAALVMVGCTSGALGEPPTGAGTTSVRERGAPSTLVASTTTTSTPSTTSAPSTTSTTTSSPTSTLPPAALEVFDEVVRAGTIGAGARAVSVALARDGRVVHAMAAGVADPLTGAPVSTEGRFRIASISKVLAAAAVLQLVDEGRIGLDEPVLDRLARRVGAVVSDPGLAAVTVRQLLSHTSGLPKGEALYFADGSTAACPDAAHRAIEGGLEATPGVRFAYSNTNFCLLGLLLEELDGVPFDEAIRRRVLVPVGADGMRVVGTYETPLGGAVHPARPGRSFMEALGAAGAWVATPSEIALVLGSLDPATALPHPLAQPTFELMRRPAFGALAGLEWTYGLGLRLWADGSWGHTGTIEQARAVAVARPDGWTAVVLVSGERPRSSDELRSVVAYALAGSGLG